MKRAGALLLAALLPAAAQRLEPAPQGNGWWALDGRPTMLIGLKTNLLSQPPEAATAQLDLLWRSGGNLLSQELPREISEETLVRLDFLLEQTARRRIVLELASAHWPEPVLLKTLPQRHVLHVTPAGEAGAALRSSIQALAATLNLPAQVVECRAALPASGTAHWQGVLTNRKATPAAAAHAAGLRAIDHFWHWLLAGTPSVVFDAPSGGLPAGGAATLRTARMIGAFTPLWEYVPRDDLLLEAPETGAFAASRRAESYLVYLPQGGEVALAAADTPHAVVWISVDTAEVEGHAIPVDGGIIPLRAPDQRRWLALVSH
jgi:hypothetical protein